MRVLRKFGWLAGFGTAVVLAAALVLPGPAQAAFPGRNGLLAVQPLNGSGVVLVKANGHGVRRVCQAGSACALGCFSELTCRGALPSLPASAYRLWPAWSRDGRALAVFGNVTSSVIYADGSCLSCVEGGSNLFVVGPVHAVFTSDPTLLTVVAGSSGHRTLSQWGVDGLPRGGVPSGVGSVSDPAWSSNGQLAVVQAGWIWVGRPGNLRRLTRGTAPSWSPYGKQIVFDRKGWVMIARLRGGSVRRVVRGTAPAWSPDGGLIAFFDAQHRLSIVPTRGGSTRRVGKVAGTEVDWQPLPSKPPTACQTPPGSTVIASSNTAIVSIDNASGLLGGWAALGCARSDGRERLLTIHGLTPPLNGMGPTNLVGAAVAGNYAALAVSSGGGRYGFSYFDSGVSLFDLRTGETVPNRGGEGVNCSGYSQPAPSCEINQLVLGSDAVSAVRTTAANNGCTCTVEQIQASDSTGLHTLDSVTEPDGSPPALTNLTLTGDTLTWNHDGAPRSAQLQP